MSLQLARKPRRSASRSIIAADVMTPNPKSISESASVREAADFLMKHGVHTAPMIDEAGRPVGVVSRTDLLDVWNRDRDRLAAMAAGKPMAEASKPAPQEWFDRNVAEIMTPVVFSVRTDTPIASVICKIAALEVRCLFVTDEHGVLVGVMSVFDLLRTLSAGAE